MRKGKHHLLGMHAAIVLVACLVQMRPSLANVIITVQENAGSVSTTTVNGSPLGSGTNAISLASTAHYSTMNFEGDLVRTARGYVDRARPAVVRLLLAMGQIE